MYSKFQLAILYYPQDIDNPKAALKKFNRAIDQCKGLRADLAATGYSSRNRDFTPLQVAIIYEKLGEPGIS